MFTIEVGKDEVNKDYPGVLDKWLSIIEKNFNKKIKDDEMELYYSYGFFIPRVNEEEYYDTAFSKCSNMNFKERYEYELSKVRINLGLKIGDFFLSDKMEGDYLPDTIKDVVEELTKVKMIFESDYHDNQDVKDSIPEVDDSVVSFDFEIIEDIPEDEYLDMESDLGIIDKEPDFDIDLILDKISKLGISSLSKEEKEFLNKKSKDI